MHKHTKVPPTLREEVYHRWIGGQSQRSLANEYHVNKKIIHRIIVRGRLNDFSVHDILPDKSQESSTVFGDMTEERLPFDIRDWYTDRGTEWKGTKDHAFVAWCLNHGITQHFTKPRTPKTNGKAERVIRTLMEEWHRRNRFASREERRRLLYAFVDFFNHERVHGTIGMTPTEKLAQYAKRLESVDNAV
jgi:transposase InsO family protein